MSSMINVIDQCQAEMKHVSAFLSLIFFLFEVACIINGIFEHSSFSFVSPTLENKSMVTLQLDSNSFKIDLNSLKNVNLK